MDDLQLLREFAANRSETAFRTIVNRYVDLVHSVALRRVADVQLAEDISQAVFILLARKAPRISAGTVLAGWLYRTTQFVAGRALRSKLRRERREMEAVQMQENASSDSNWQRLAPLLDEALEKLNDTDRNAIILRYFQENSLLKVGLALGVSEAAAGKRVSRALESMRSYFGRRGFATTTAVIATTLAHGAKAAPSNLSQTIVTSLFMHLPSTSTVHFALVQETLKAWRWAKLRWIAAGSAVVVTAVFLATSSTSRSPASSTASATNRTVAENLATPTTPQPENTPTTPATTTVARTNDFTFWAVDALTGKGVTGAKVMAVVAQDPQHIDRYTNLVTDSNGSCVVPRPPSGEAILAVGVLANGYEERCAVGGGPKPLTNNYILKLPRGSSISGVVQDESGKPVAGADIQIQFAGTGDSSDSEFQAERPGFPDDFAVASTDDAGRWTFQSAPESNDDFYIAVKHPSYPTADFHPSSDARNYLTPVAHFKLEELRAGSAVFVLSSGLGLRGTVTDEQQNPVADAKVSYGDFADSGPSVKTGADGAFTLTPLSTGRGHITIQAKGFAPDRLPVEVASNSPALAIQLKPAARLRLRVVDESGNAKEHVDVRLQAWRGYNTLNWGGFTDSDGRIEWDSAPQDALNIYAGKQGFFSSRDNIFTADGAEHTITLHPQITVSGSVTDAESGQPITAFKAIPGSDRLELVHGTNGEYTLTFQESSQPLLVHFEADGYEPATSEPLPTHPTTQSCSISLKRQNPSQVVQGAVLLADGSPAAGAQVALCTAEKGVTIEGGKFLSREGSILTTADANGRFTFPADVAPQAVVAIHEQGFAQLKLETNNRVALSLKPWGRIEGVLNLRSRKNANRQIILRTRPQALGVSATARIGSRPISAEGQIRVNFSADTDAQGNFVFDRLPQGDFDLYLFPGLYLPWSHQTPVQVQPGETLAVQIGGTGGTVTGQFASSDPGRAINWPRQIYNATISTRWKPAPVPPELTGAARRQWVQTYWQSEEGQAVTRAMRNYPLTVESDGTFTAEDVPPGAYNLNATVSSVLADDGDITVAIRAPMLGSVRQEIIVPETAGNPTSDPVNLGTVTVKIK
jgi:RNA polymerase sigma factor (sigma-70 family)